MCSVSVVAPSFALEPVTLELGNVLTGAARASFSNVAREMFSVNPLQAAIMAAQVEAGPLEIALRDNGGVELMVTQYARTQKVSREDPKAMTAREVWLNVHSDLQFAPRIRAVRAFLKNTLKRDPDMQTTLADGVPQPRTADCKNP